MLCAGKLFLDKGKAYKRAGLSYFDIISVFIFVNVHYCNIWRSRFGARRKRTVCVAVTFSLDFTTLGASGCTLALVSQDNPHFK